KKQNELHDDNPLFQQAVAFINDHLSDPELSPQMIADYFYVSLRQLHSKFSEEDQTISSYIRNERIRRIRQALADPTAQDETIQPNIRPDPFWLSAHHFRAITCGATGFGIL